MFDADISIQSPLANPDLELWEGGRGEGGGTDFAWLALSAFRPSVISSVFTQNKGGGEGHAPRAPSFRSATGHPYLKH